MAGNFNIPSLHLAGKHGKAAASGEVQDNFLFPPAAEKATAAIPSRSAVVVAGVLLLVAIAAAIAWFVLRPVPSTAGPVVDPNAQAAPQTTDAGVPAGSYRLVVNQVATMSTGSTQCALGFENPEGNGYSANVALVLDETGEQLVQVGPVRPGERLDQVALARELEPGAHAVTVRVGVLSDNAEVSELTAAISIDVQEKE